MKVYRLSPPAMPNCVHRSTHSHSFVTLPLLLPSPNLKPIPHHDPLSTSLLIHINPTNIRQGLRFAAGDIPTVPPGVGQREERLAALDAHDLGPFALGCWGRLDGFAAFGFEFGDDREGQVNLAFEDRGAIGEGGGRCSPVWIVSDWILLEED